MGDTTGYDTLGRRIVDRSGHLAAEGRATVGYWSPPAWTESALCTQTDPEMFFPDKGGSTAAAKTVCRRCPVRAECLDYALANGERFGVWGGLSERERRAAAKTGRTAA